MARLAGLFMSGESKRVLLVGPIDPATNRGFVGVEYCLATSIARRAAS